MRRRLLLSYLSLVLLILVILEVSLGAPADRHERSLLASQAVEEATGLAIVAAEDLQHGVGLSALVHRYHQAGGSEVLVVYASGTEAVDSDNDPTSDRSEIAPQLEDAASNGTATRDNYRRAPSLRLRCHAGPLGRRRRADQLPGKR
jgi:hypothetical protein